MIVRFTSWQINHLIQAKGQKKKSTIDQKVLPWISYPMIAVTMHMIHANTLPTDVVVLLYITFVSILFNLQIV